MYAGTDYQPADPEESEMYTFNFSNDLGESETITGATWSIKIVDGEDAAFASRLISSPENDNTKTSQRVAGLLPGVQYMLQAVVTTSDGNTLSLWSHVQCDTPK